MRKLLMSLILIATFSINPILTYADVTDTTAPKAEFITLSPATLTASGGELTVEFIVSDEVSGLAATNSNGAVIPSITFKLRNSDKTFSPANVAILYKGDSTYGSYRCLISIPGTLANGTWELFINPLRDQAGNSTTQISTGLTFLLGSATAAPTSPPPAGGTGATSPTTTSASPETPAPTPSVKPSSTATPTGQVTPTPVATATEIATSPTVLAKPSPTPTITKAAVKKAAPKKNTITCRKGKLIKKVTGIKPKCPKGYK
jgi:hypothetical protein